MKKFKSTTFSSLKTSEVRAKKHLGQHFLTDENIAKKIVELVPSESKAIIEVGPGMGVLTQFLVQKETPIFLSEIDTESIAYLEVKYADAFATNQFLFIGDILKLSDKDFEYNEYAILGNFPYNISSQIVFKILDFKDKIPFWCGMFQKEVAERLAAPHGSKTYGITSVLTQSFYDISYEFTVGPQVFSPPPKVDSGVISCVRRNDINTSVSPEILKSVVKESFNQRRKKMSNSLSRFIPENKSFPWKDLRPEQVSVAGFQEMAIWVYENKL